MIGFILCFTLRRILEALRNRTGTYLESLLLLVNHQEAFFISGQLPMLSYFATGPRDSGGISAQVDHSCHFPRLLPPNYSSQSAVYPFFIPIQNFMACKSLLLHAMRGERIYKRKLVKSYRPCP